MMDKAREIALKVLFEVDQKGAYSNIALNEALKRARKNASVSLDNRDVGFISEIVYGTISWRLAIDEVIKMHSKVKFHKLSPWILDILRMSIFQILFLDRVPKSAAVNEGVFLAKRYGHKASSNFVNAVLRRVEKKDFESFFAIYDEVERISKTTSMPVWLTKKLIDQYSLPKAEEICKASNLKPCFWIRTNSLKTNKQDLIELLQKEKMKVEEGEMENFLKVEGAKNIEGLTCFEQGWFTPQDEAAGFIPYILDPKPGERVLDACSSPGGKTTLMAELMKNEGEIKAWDIQQHRVDLVNRAVSRLGITIVETTIKDARKYDEAYVEYFDKILLDVPCLGIGVLKRKPDIKWKRKKEDIEQITKLQEEILQTCSKYLKKGGFLVYSTCSILREENEGILNQFIEKNPNFEIIKLEKMKSSFFEKFVENEKFLKICQNEISDGFFAGKLRKM